jgi:hypothetical protein
MADILRSRIFKDGILQNGGGGGPGSDTDAIHDNVANEINAVTAKATPVAADVVLIEDSADSWNKKKIALTDLLGGGGGASPFDASFGTGGDYANVGAAVTAGKSNLVQVGASTETGNIAVPAGGLSIYKSLGINMAMGIYKFTFAGDYPLWIEGEGPESTITNSATSDYTFDNATGRVYLKNIKLTNSRTFWINAGVVHAVGCTIQFPNTNICGIRGFTGTSLHHCHLIGAGSNCKDAISTVTGIDLTDTYVTGAFETTLSTGAGFDFNSGDYCSIEGMTINLTASSSIMSMYWSSIGGMNGIRFLSGQARWEFNTSTDGTYVNDCDFGPHTSSFDLGSSSNLSLSKLRSLDTLDMTDANCSNNTVNDSRITNAVTMNGDNNKTSDNKFLGGLQDNGTDNGHNNNQYGPDAGGGVLTLTLGAAAVRPRVGMCMTDAAISDLGSTTPAISPNTNTVY